MIHIAPKLRFSAFMNFQGDGSVEERVDKSVIIIPVKHSLAIYYTSDILVSSCFLHPVSENLRLSEEDTGTVHAQHPESIWMD